MIEKFCVLLLLAVACDAFTAPAAFPVPLAGLKPALSLRRASTLSLSMQAEESKPRAKSWFSRNVEDKPRGRKYYEIEERGEFLAGPDRADEWGEELTEIGKWQRTMGPIYVQGFGGALLVGGFINYFALSNLGSLSSAMWCTGILVALLGFALQRKTGA